MSNPLHAFFVRIPVFSGLSTEELEDIVRIVRPVNFTTGQVIFAEGTPGDAAYVIQSGHIEVFRKVDGKEVVVQKLTAWEIFGELSLLDGEPRSASCRAVADATLLRIDKAEFDFLRRNLRPAAYVVIRSIAATLAARIRETNIQVARLLAPPTAAARTERKPEPDAEPVSKSGFLKRLLGGGR